MSEKQKAAKRSGAERLGEIEAAIGELLQAAEEFTERGADLRDAICHRGLMSEMECSRCSRHRRLREAIDALAEAGR